MHIDSCKACDDSPEANADYDGNPDKVIDEIVEKTINDPECLAQLLKFYAKNRLS